MTSDLWAQWEAKGLTEVELPSGMLVQLRIPGPDVVVRNEVFPDSLREAVLKGHLTQLKEPNFSAEEQRQWLASWDEVVCQSVERARPDETADWQPITLTPEKLQQIPDDAAALRAVVQREASPEVITAIARRDRGLATDDDVIAARRKELGGRVADWRSFRDLARILSDRGTGAALEPTPIRPAGNNRAARRTRGGRRASSAAGA